MERNPSENAEEPVSYRFALRPKWLLSHLLVLLLVVVMVNIAFWQLRPRRTQALNAAVRENASAEPVPVPVGIDRADVGELVWRPVEVEGRYREGADVLVANRTLNGQPGYWLVTPLDPEDGSATVAIVRGFVTRALVSQGDLAETAAPSGDVRVTGYVQASRVEAGSRPSARARCPKPPASTSGPWGSDGGPSSRRCGCNSSSRTHRSPPTR
jgi:surfeit locus 1 family protein